MKHDYHEARLVAIAIAVVPIIWVIFVEINHPIILLAAMVIAALCWLCAFTLFRIAKKWQKEQQLETQDE